MKWIRPGHRIRCNQASSPDIPVRIRCNQASAPDTRSGGKMAAAPGPFEQGFLAFETVGDTVLSPMMNQIEGVIAQLIASGSGS